MSSSNSPTLIRELPSGWSRLVPAAALLLVGLLLPWLALPTAPGLRSVMMLCAVALAMWAGWQGGVGTAARRPVRVTWLQSGEWRLQFAKGEPITVVLSPCSWCSPWVMCWRFIDSTGHRHALLLWRAELSADSWHPWQLRLRLEGTRAVPPSAIASLQ